MGSAVFFEPWAFVCLVSLAGSCGAALASRFDGVTLTPGGFVVACAIPAVLAMLFSGAGVPLHVALWTFALVGALSALSVIDATTRTVPDAISVPMIALGLVHCHLSGLNLWIFGGFSFAIIVLGLAGQILIRAESWVGGGDVLLFAGAVAWLGPGLLPDVILLAAGLLCLRLAAESLAAPRAVICLPTHVQQDTGVPLAPSLGAAQLLIWFGGPLF